MTDGVGVTASAGAWVGVGAESGVGAEVTAASSLAKAGGMPAVVGLCGATTCSSEPRAGSGEFGAMLGKLSAGSLGIRDGAGISGSRVAAGAVG